MIAEGNREGLAIEDRGRDANSERRVIRVPHDVIRLYVRPALVRVDNAPELTAEAVVDWCAAQRIGTDQITFIERFDRGFHEKVLDAHLFESLEQMHMITPVWLETHNIERPHDSLVEVPPSPFCQVKTLAAIYFQSVYVTRKLTDTF